MNAEEQKAKAAPVGERQAFEAWFNREVWTDGCYGNPDILMRQLWPCWQARAALSAAGKSEQQPIGWITEDYLTDKSATTYSPEVADRWRTKGWPVNEIYATPTTTGPDVGALVERLQMQLAACGVVALANTPESAARARDMHPDYMSASCSDVMRAVDREMHQRAALLDWAVDRWHAEVSQRPLVNVNRRSIDDTWRQIIRKLGGDPVDLCGPAHDTLLASAEAVKNENV